MSFSKEYQVRKDEVEEYINQMVGTIVDVPEPLISAIKYSLFNGGKRIRPVLFLEVLKMYGYEIDSAAIKIMCAIEFIHTYSLIHDDLPSMDNDDFRRGQPTSHKVYGEDVAILAGDALLNLAFEYMFSAIVESKNTLATAKACKFISNKVGGAGLIAGQILDLDLVNKEEPSAAIINNVYYHKTGDLIVAALVGAAMMCEASEEDIDILTDYGYNYGYSFQIKDDIADFESGEKMKNTFVQVFGIKNSKVTLADVVTKAVEFVDYLEKDTSFLKRLALKSIKNI